MFALSDRPSAKIHWNETLRSTISSVYEHIEHVNEILEHYGGRQLLHLQNVNGKATNALRLLVIMSYSVE
jgi:hypothetical protein